MRKIIQWSPEQASKELAKRLAFAKKARQPLEAEWRRNEIIAFSLDGVSLPGSDVEVSSPDETGNVTSPDIAVNYVMKDVRYIHSQLALNSFSVVPRPTSSDPEDRRAADAADRIGKHGLRQYALQETFDLVTWDCMIYGTGIGRGYFDPESGDILDYDKETDTITMEGDYQFKRISPWNYWPDPDATNSRTKEYEFEGIPMRYENACSIWPQHTELLKKYRVANREDTGQEDSSQSALRKSYYDIVWVYYYSEIGTPTNGMLGRQCYHLEDGQLLTPVVPSSHSFHRTKGTKRKLDRGTPKVARSSYHMLTDLDVPGSIWGRAILSYAAQLQDTVNRIDNVTLDILKAHGIPRIILHENASISDDSITTTPTDVIKWKGQVPPSYMEPLPIPASMPNFRDKIREGIDDTMGVNESMFGQQSRETASQAMQYATQQGNIIRRRLFNKIVNFTENVYEDYFDIVKEFWKTNKTIAVLGKEHAFEARDLSGADIDGGYDIVVEYGTSLSLDPMSRRQEIITLSPLFKEAGVSARTILQFLKLNELSGAYDMIQLATTRQQEIFDEMSESLLYIKPEELEDHKNMLEYCYYFRMSSSYKYLSKDQQMLIEQHIKDREAMLATRMASAATPTEPEVAPPTM